MLFMGGDELYFHVFTLRAITFSSTNQRLGNHLPSSHLVAMMPKAKTTAAKPPIIAA